VTPHRRCGPWYPFGSAVSIRVCIEVPDVAAPTSTRASPNTDLRTVYSFGGQLIVCDPQSRAVALFGGPTEVMGKAETPTAGTPAKRPAVSSPPRSRLGAVAIPTGPDSVKEAPVATYQDPVRIELPLMSAPEEMFVGSRPRRCAACGAVAIARVHGEPRHGFACAGCGLPAPRGRSGTRCPWCTSVLRDKDGKRGCPSHCPSVPDAAREPRSAWEGAFTEEAARSYPAEWGLAGGGDWDRYGGASRLQARFGAREDERDILGTEDDVLEQARAENTERVAEMAYALRSFARHNRAPVKGGKKPLPRWYRILAMETWTYYREVVGELAAILVNALSQRGEPYDGMADRVYLRQARGTPFSSYRHALGAAFGTTSSDASSHGPRGGSVFDKGVPYKYSLPKGVQLGRMAVAPTKNGAAPRTREHGTAAHDASECILAARVGGTWTSATWRLDGTPESPAHSEGGYPLGRSELRLLELVELGAPTMVKDGRTKTMTTDWAKLSIREALTRIKAQRAVYPDARHWTEGQARQALAEAREATRSAFEAWGLIPVREPEPREEDGDRVSGVEPIAVVELLAPTWDAQTA
jgi:hypothetical protein